MASVHAPRHPQPPPHSHQHSIASSTSSRSPFRRANRVAYPFGQPTKSSYASAAAASSSSSSTAAPRAQHAHQPSQPPPQQPPCIDMYYGHEDTSKLCARFVSHTFNCPEVIPPAPTQQSNSSSTSPTAVVSRSSSVVTASGNAPSIPNTLAHFVAYALHRTRLHPSVVFTALALLQRLKTRFPAARGSSGHRLFLAAYMLASKVVCDDTYSNKSWAVVGQGMFPLREINQMEREMLAYLEWGLNVPVEDLTRFEKEVKRIYGGSGNGGGRDGASGNGRDSWGKGVEMRLTAGVGGIKPPEDGSIEEPSSLILAIPTTGANLEKSPKHPYQLPTPTDAGHAAVPISRPVLPPISTAVNVVSKPPAYPSPPTSPPSATAALDSTMCHSDCSSSSSASPVDGESEDESDCEEDDAYPPFAHHTDARDGSPSPTSSEDSATLPTPPNSALSSAGPHGRHGHDHRRLQRGYTGYGPKMGKSHSVPAPSFAYSREKTGRSSAPPVSTHSSSVTATRKEREPVVSSVSASHFGAFPTMASMGVEEDGDAVMAMELEDEKRGGVAYYATVHHPRPASASATAIAPTRSSASASVAAKRDPTIIREREREGRREREKERSLKTYTVPCAW